MITFFLILIEKENSLHYLFLSDIYNAILGFNSKKCMSHRSRWRFVDILHVTVPVLIKLMHLIWFYLFHVCSLIFESAICCRECPECQIQKGTWCEGQRDSIAKGNQQEDWGNSPTPNFCFSSFTYLRFSLKTFCVINFHNIDNKS